MSDHHCIHDHGKFHNKEHQLKVITKSLQRFEKYENLERKRISKKLHAKSLEYNKQSDIGNRILFKNMKKYYKKNKDQLKDVFENQHNVGLKFNRLHTQNSQEFIKEVTSKERVFDQKVKDYVKFKAMVNEEDKIDPKFEHSKTGNQLF